VGLGRSENLGQEYRGRIMVLGIFILFLFLLLLIKLFSLQITNQLTYSKRAQQVAQRSSTIYAQRGKIYDRNGDYPLVDNIDSFRLLFTPAEAESIDPVTVLENLHNSIGPAVNLNKILESLPSNWRGSYLPVEVATGISFSEIIPIAENISQYPGISWESSPLRYYNQTGSISHILGYVGRITLEEWQVLYNQGYENDAVIGKTGIERVYDSFMRGKNGTSYKTVDVRGRNLQDAEMIPPENGYDITLTIDRHIQTLAEKALGERKGSLVVIKPSTGEVLALVSYPNYNPNLFFEDGGSSFRELSLNRDFPFLNRAIQSAYAPASTFKVIMTFALLAEGYDPSTEIYCSGSMTLGDREFHCHKKSGHGSLDLYHGLAESCNIYFGTAGVETLGIEKIYHYAKMLGLGDVSGFEIPGEVSGVMPNPEWKEEVYHTPWTDGDTLNVSIGQGFVSTTPLQMANAISMIVNNGVLYRPHVLMRATDPTTGEVMMEQYPEIIRDISSEIPEEVFQQTRDAMREVIVTGTAEGTILNNAVHIAGKTGTGEVGLDENFHAWFVSFGPYDTDDPSEQLVVVSQVEAFNEEWDWWAIKAADMVYQGIFGSQTYEEVITSMKRRGVWYVRELEVE